MKLLPYLNFNGNCAKAIAFYEKVFNAKTESCFWGDIGKFDPKMQCPKGKEKLVMHACMNIADGVTFQLADCEDTGKDVGTNICLQLTYKTANECKSVYEALKVGGKVLCKLAPTFYAPLYADLIDKFGIRWSIIQDNPAQ